MALRLKRIGSGSYSHSTAESTTAKTLIDRQLGYERETKSLVFDDAGTICKYPVSAGYSVVISNQAEFDTWAANPAGSTVLIRPGNYALRTAIELGSQVIFGYGANISVSVGTFNSIKTSAFIASGDSTYTAVIRGLRIFVNGDLSSLPNNIFKNCLNLYDITVFISSTNCSSGTHFSAFSYCSLLTGCRVIFSAAISVNCANGVYGFNRCHLLSTCTVTLNKATVGVGKTTGLVGFYNCYGVTSCAVLSGDVAPTPTSVGFQSCYAVSGSISSGKLCSTGSSNVERPFYDNFYLAACAIRSGASGDTTGSYIDPDSTGW